MKLLQYLKALSDISFLYATFGTLVLLLFSCNTSVVPLFLLALVLPLGYILKGKRYRLFAFAPALLLIPFVQMPADILMPIGVLVYLFLAMKHEAYYYTSYHEIDRFRWQVIVLPILILFCALFGLGEMMAQFTLPRTMLYLLSANLFLRLIRADKETLASPSFLSAHLVSLVALIIAAMILSSEKMYSAVLSVLYFLYQSCIVPAFAAVAMAALGAIMLVIRIIMWIFGGITLEEVTSASADYSVMQYVEEETLLSQTNVPSWLEWTLTLLFAAFVVALACFVVRKMLSGLRQNSADGYVAITSERLAPEDTEKRSLFFLTPRQKLRNCYAEFMRYAKKKGIKVKKSTDTAQLAQRFGVSPQTMLLTEAYRHARYDEACAVEKEDVEKARAALKEIKAGEKAKNSK